VICNVRDPTTWLGLDLGTQSVRAVAVSASGDMLTSGTVLLVDSAGEPVWPALMYDDSRVVDDAGRANEVGAAVWDSLGYRMQPSWALPKLLWLLREHGERGHGARLAHQVDFVTRRLVGREVPADGSHALKTGYDLLHDAWPHEVMTALGVPVEMLPDVVRCGTRLGAVGAAGAEATGINEGTPVIAGMTDGCAAQLAAGALSEGSWNSVLGTTLALKGVCVRADPRSAGHRLLAPLARRPLAAGRRLERRRRRALGPLCGPRPPGARPASGAARAGGRAGLSARRVR